MKSTSMDDTERQGFGGRAANDAGAKLPHVMVVEDDASLRASWMFERWRVPLRLSVAEDGYRANMAMADDLPDLVITDLHMPNIDGHKLIEIMGRTPPFDRIPIVVLSGACTDELLGLPGVIACFSKSISFADLQRYVELQLTREPVADVAWQEYPQ